MRLLPEIWPYILAALVPVVQATASAHVILRKRDVRAAVGWVGLIWLAPVVGAVAYAMLGVNTLGDRVSGRPLLASYIFDAGPVGDLFVEALGAARRRGVEVRVLVDDVGARYSRPRIARPLRRQDVRVAHFMPGLLPWRMLTATVRS